MDFYFAFRPLLCLLIAFVLIFNVYAIPVKAVAVSGSLVAVGATIVIASVLIGIGISKGSSPDDFNLVTQNLYDHLSSLGHIAADGTMLLLRLGEPGSFRMYVPENIIDIIRDFIISTAVVVKFASLGSSVIADKYSKRSEAIRNRLVEAQSFNYILCVYRTSSFHIYVSDVPFSISETSSGNETYIQTADGSAFARSIAGGAWAEVAIAKWSHTTSFSIDQFVGSGMNTISSVFDLAIGDIVISADSVADSYGTWSGGSVEVEDDSGSPIPYWPLGLGDNYESTLDLTQEEAWNVGEVAVPDVGTGTGSGTISGTITLPGWVQDGINNLLQGLRDLLSGVLSLPASIASSIWDALPSWLQEGIISLKTGLLDILDSIASLPVAIAEALAAVFVPSADYISAKVEALRGEFGFIDSVIATGEFIRDSVSGASGPPVIYVDLGRAPSGNYGSQSVLLTDFSWYAPYKGQVDTVLSAALWAFFGWRVFLKLPGIIGGESGYISDVFFPSSSGRSGSDDKKKGGKV